jgi:atrazine chlorohydrolase/5-methylthioadenosine/S-adenosylhomocysteine deaminase/melamine deaminase
MTTRARTSAPDLLITNTWVVTIDPDRREFRPGFVAVADDRIAAVGPMADCPYERASETIDGSGKAVLPGFINAHTHAIYNLLRGGLSDDRMLYDWLLNVVHPGLKAITPDDARIAASLFCLEALRSGITTFVDNADSARFPDVAEATLSTYERLGVRVVYARMFADIVPPEVQAYTEAVIAREPGVQHYTDSLEETGRAIESIESLMRQHHGRGEGRIQVWPAPGVAIFTTVKGLMAAKDLARRWGTMLTIHVAESPFDRLQGGVSSVQYLATIGFLGPDVLANHCVQVDTNDVAILKAYDVKIAYNPVSNMFLGSGIAPIAEMLRAGITVAIGTDDPNCNSSVNMISDLKFAVLAQKGRYRYAAAMTAERAVEMATIDGARAIGMDSEIGSLEVGKKADVIVVDLARPQTAPAYNVASVLVYQASGEEVDTVIVDGRVLMRNRALMMLEPEEQKQLLVDIQRASGDVVERAGLQRMRDRGWRSEIGI